MAICAFWFAIFITSGDFAWKTGPIYQKKKAPVRRTGAPPKRPITGREGC
jgi:hypothetical protein